MDAIRHGIQSLTFSVQRFLFLRHLPSRFQAARDWQKGIESADFKSREEAKDYLMNTPDEAGELSIGGHVAGQQLSRRLRSLIEHGQLVAPSRVFMSPFKRAIQTYQYISSALSHDQVSFQDGRIGERRCSQWRKDYIPGVDDAADEPIESLSIRQLSFLKDLAVNESHTGMTLWIVTHKDFFKNMLQLTYQEDNVDLNEAFRNGNLVELSTSGGRKALCHYNRRTIKKDIDLGSHY